jgi:hypothetical protein
VRRSEATERESKDPCTLALPTKHQGILTVPSMIELLAVCKRRGTCCRVPYLFVIPSASRRNDPARFARTDAPAFREPTPARTTVEERRFSAAFSVPTSTGL